MIKNKKNFIIIFVIIFFNMLCIESVYSRENIFTKIKNKKTKNEYYKCKFEKPILNYEHKIKNNDKYGRANRFFLKINLFIMRNSILPFLYVIDSWIPSRALDLFMNFSDNLLEPKNFIIYKLSGEDEKAKLSMERFFINTFLGAGGLMNPAQEKFGEKYRRENVDFDYVFFKKNIDKGDFHISLLINEHYEREAIGKSIDFFLNPILYMISFPYNFGYILFYELVLLTDKKDTLFYNRKYTESLYNNIKDLKTYEVSNY